MFVSKVTTMKLFPWNDVTARAKVRIAGGAQVFQQWVCARCGSKQTMPDPNHFYQFGICEECNHITDIKSRGCNYCVILGTNANHAAEILQRHLGKQND